MILQTIAQISLPLKQLGALAHTRMRSDGTIHHRRCGGGSRASICLDPAAEALARRYFFFQWLIKNYQLNVVKF